MHKNSFLLYEKYAKPFFKDLEHVVEIGPEGIPSPYCKAVNRPGVKWDTLDIVDNPLLTYSGIHEYDYPISDSTYDVILSGQVFEHVRKIWRWMPELARIRKPNGYVITISLVSNPYHDAPHDCWRAYPEGMKALCEDSGFSSIEGTKYRRTIGRGRRRTSNILIVPRPVAG